MRWHVIFAFRPMLEERISIWDEPRDESLEVPADCRVSVFLNQQRS